MIHIPHWGEHTHNSGYKMDLVQSQKQGGTEVTVGKSFQFITKWKLGLDYFILDCFLQSHNLFNGGDLLIKHW